MVSAGLKNKESKYPLSLFSLLTVILVLIVVRFFYWHEMLHVLTWDAAGYYLYLPGKYIYHDVFHFDWLNKVSEKYSLPGNLYGVTLEPNGNYVMFYSIGVSMLETPFFFIGHWSAGILGYPQDGFAPPYQIAICIGMLVYVCIGLCTLRIVLLHYFSDSVVAWSILLTVLATNFPEYTAIEAGMSHGYIFTIYCLLLYFSWRWHETPTRFFAGIIGFLIGLGTVCRPTEAIMLCIPLLWDMQTKQLRRKKWTLIRDQPSQLLAAVVGGVVPLLPQFFYCKLVTGQWIHKMGSRWDFLNPHWQIIIGWEKGWFIYTPVAIFMVLGVFFIQKKEYRTPIITYFILNLWIIMAWHVWRFGASYSCRALMQSLAVMTFPLAALTEKIIRSKLRVGAVIFSTYLIIVNLFQIWQYSKTIIHYDDMNMPYYAAVYLNPSPSPIDMSLLDTDECLRDTSRFYEVKKNLVDSIITLYGGANSTRNVCHQHVSSLVGIGNKQIIWLKVSVMVQSQWGAFGSNVVTELLEDSIVKKRTIRLQNGICDIKKWNEIAFYFRIPINNADAMLSIYVDSPTRQRVSLKDFTLSAFIPK